MNFFHFKKNVSKIGPGQNLELSKETDSELLVLDPEHCFVSFPSKVCVCTCAALTVASIGQSWQYLLGMLQVPVLDILIMCPMYDC